jgi:hypothetical protein
MVKETVLVFANTLTFILSPEGERMFALLS